MNAAAAFLAGAAVASAAAAAVARISRRRWAQARGRLLAFALHELNTPATAANLALVNLIDGLFGDLTPTQAKWVGTARDQLARMSAVAGEMRDAVHLELLQKLETHAEPASAAELVETALASVRGAFEHAAIPLDAEIEPGLPPVLADADRTARTLAGLLYHARKFRAAGAVRLRARREGENAACEIDYESVAVAPADAEASLELLYPARPRGDHRLSASGGGLGLAREVMRRCGGDVDYAVSGGRARLTLLLPFAP